MFGDFCFPQVQYKALFWSVYGTMFPGYLHMSSILYRREADFPPKMSQFYYKTSGRNNHDDSFMLFINWIHQQIFTVNKIPTKNNVK